MVELLKDNLPKIAKYRGRICGSIIGFLTGIFWICFGFWKALAFLICVSIGYFLGKRFDEEKPLISVIKKMFPTRKE